MPTPENPFAPHDAEPTNKADLDPKPDAAATEPPAKKTAAKKTAAKKD